MPDSTAQVVIIGAGIMGTSIAYHLAARCWTDVLMLEQAETEISGSTARSAAGVRHQFSTEVNVRLSLYGVERLKHFTEEILDGRAHTIDIDELRITRFAIERLHHELNIV